MRRTSRAGSEARAIAKPAGAVVTTRKAELAQAPITGRGDEIGRVAGREAFQSRAVLQLRALQLRPAL